jgi:hypothetical protein
MYKDVFKETLRAGKIRKQYERYSDMSSFVCDFTNSILNDDSNVVPDSVKLNLITHFYHAYEELKQEERSLS